MADVDVGAAPCAVSDNVCMKALTRAKPQSESKPPRKIAGVGKFHSGVRDLGSNKTHLKNFGR